jgi:hypothetical protein
MAQITFRKANRRYMRIFGPVMVGYAVLCFAGPMALSALGGEPPRWAYAGLALVNAAPIGVVFWLMWRWLRETDEFTRDRHMSALAASGMITASAAVLWGFLELYDVVPSLWTFLIGPMFFAVYGSICVARALAAGSRA